jgi:hypothetical protein
MWKTTAVGKKNKYRMEPENYTFYTYTYNYNTQELLSYCMHITFRHPYQVKGAHYVETMPVCLPAVSNLVSATTLVVKFS